MNLPEFGSVLREYVGFLPGLVASLIVGWLLARRVGALLGVRPVHGMAVVVGFGLVLSATVSPGIDTLQGAVGTGTCDFTRIGLPSLNQLRWPGEILLNILLFVPLGLALGACPPSGARLVALGLGYALPFAIEATQLVVVGLGRECQSGDVIDNLTGLTLGMTVASGGLWIFRAQRDRRELRPLPRPAVAGFAGLATLALASAFLLAAEPSSPTGVPSLPPGPTNSPETPPPGASVRVDAIPALLNALADDRIGEIVVADGTYQVSPASDQQADSLWIGERFSARTNPVLVRAETRGRVILDGGGNDSFGGLTFAEGAHHQTWDGFTLANGQPTETGAIVFGGYAGRPAPHHITLRNFTFTASVTGRATSASAPGLDHAIYVSQAVDGPHDLVFEDIAVDGRGGLASAFVFFHSDASNRNAWNVTIRRLAVVGTQQAIILWDPTLRDITIDTAVIRDALSTAVTFESPGASGIVLANITSTDSGSGRGFVSTLGPSPPGVTFTNDSFR